MSTNQALFFGVKTMSQSKDKFVKYIEHYAPSFSKVKKYIIYFFEAIQARKMPKVLNAQLRSQQKREKKLMICLVDQRLIVC